MQVKKKISGFLHFRTDLGDGIQTGVVFSDCTEECRNVCSSFRFISEHPFAEDSLEQTEYSSEELLRYLLEEKTLYYNKKIGITFLGREPLRDPFFCADVARGLKKAGVGLQIYTCGMCSMTAFEELCGLVDLYVIRVFLPLFTKEENTVFDRNKHVLRIIEFLERHHSFYRILIHVDSDVSTADVDAFSEYALTLSCLKSVILDFSHSNLPDSEKAEIKSAFLKRKIPLY